MLFHYLIKRLFSAIFVLFGITTIVFFLIHIVPGDPVEIMLGEMSNPADRTFLRQALGLDQPLSVQWWHYIRNTIQLDFGISLYSKQPVADIIFERLPATIMLSIAGLLLAILIAFPLGVIAALYRASAIDHTAMIIAVLGVSIPNFVMGPVLILVFAIWLKLLPVSGMDGVLSLLLPALTLGTALAAILSRMLRAAILEILNEDYIRAAYARGLHIMQILIHILRNASLPVMTIIGAQIGALLTGSVITEIIFSWPGIGQLMVDSIRMRDYPVLQACVLLISVIYVGVNLCTDLLYSVLDPRVKLAT